MIYAVIRGKTEPIKPVSNDSELSAHPIMWDFTILKRQIKRRYSFITRKVSKGGHAVNEPNSARHPGFNLTSPNTGQSVKASKQIAAVWTEC